jgi:hypothetical protein
MQVDLPNLLAIGGGVGVILVFLAYALAAPKPTAAKTKVPLTVLGIVAGMVLGAGVAMVVMHRMGYSLTKPSPDSHVGIQPVQAPGAWAPPPSVSRSGAPSAKPPETK